MTYVLLAVDVDIRGPEKVEVHTPELPRPASRNFLDTNPGLPGS